ncbi:tyrosine-type recombinase/integrase [Hoeflea sp. 108]|uniref:tyrosine-type recombinase/integrase n=1 Tax=Hoeflea sp. 108 TaxID=1116369 RepID=UPI0012F78054|nr:tyrosine-type recombinase/integrase [Hoeflea sp. 108]
MRIVGSRKEDGLPYNKKHLERGLNFTVVRQQVWREGRVRRWPVLYVIVSGSDGSIQSHRYNHLEDYFFENDSRCEKWQSTTAQAIGLLIDFSVAAIQAMPLSFIQTDCEPLERRLLRGFALALLHGTSLVRDGGRADPFGLFWNAKGRDRTGRLLGALTRHLEWLGDKKEESRWAWAACVKAPGVNPTHSFRVAAELAIRTRYSFLKHLRERPHASSAYGQPSPNENKNKSHRFTGVVGPARAPSGPVHFFPPKYLAPLLFEGFSHGRDHSEHDEAAEIIALILAVGGLRTSEPFHSYVSDVQFIQDRVLMFFQNPDDGSVINNQDQVISRASYLESFNLLPRNLDKHRNHVGWKGMGISAGDTTQAYWLPLEPAIIHLTHRLRKYLFVTRPSIMARRPKILGDHPFLFVSSGRSAGDGQGNVGDPYTITAFRAAWTRAIRRLARNYQDPSLIRSKEMGTTPHGLRHLYGRILKSLGVDGVIIQKCMHHTSIYSHLIYTRLLPSEVSDILDNHASLFKDKLSSDLTHMWSDLAARVKLQADGAFEMHSFSHRGY